MESFEFTFKYTKGMKKTLFFSFLSVLVLLIFIQGILFYTFSFQQQEIEGLLDSTSADTKIYLSFQANTLYQRLSVFNTVEQYVKELDTSIIERTSLYFDGRVTLLSKYCNVYFVDNTLSNFLFGKNITSNEIWLSKPLFHSLNYSLGEDIAVYGYNFSLSSCLSYEQFDQLDAFQAGSMSYNQLKHRQFLLENIIILNTDALKSEYFTEEVRGASLLIYYKMDATFNKRPSSILRISSKNNDLISLHLGIFDSAGIDYSIKNRLTEGLEDIQGYATYTLVIYFGLSFPLIIASLVYYVVSLKSMKRVWREQMNKLWERGFSRKQTFWLLFKVFTFVDLLVLLTIFTILLVETLFIGAIIDLSFWTLVSFCVLIFLLLVLFQIRELYNICFPKIEALSITLTEKEEYQSQIDYIRSKPSFSIKLIIISIILLIVGVVMLYYTEIIYWLRDMFDIDSILFLYGRGSDPTFVTFAQIIPLLGLTIIIATSVFLLIKYLDKIRIFISKILLGRRGRKENALLFINIFRKSLYQRRKMGTVLFLLFFGFSFTWLFTNTLIIEQSEQSAYLSSFGPGEISIFPRYIENYSNLTYVLEDIISLPEVELSTEEYSETTNIVVNGVVNKITLKVFDPFTLPSFIENTLDRDFFEYHSIDDVFTGLQENPLSCIIDFRTCSKLGLSLNDNLSVVGSIGGIPYAINVKLLDICKFDVITPRWGMHSYILIPKQAFEFHLDISKAHAIYLNIKDSVTLDSFLQQLYDNYSLPLYYVKVAKGEDPHRLGVFQLYLEISSLIIILLTSIPLVYDIFYSNTKSLAKLYSRGFSFRTILNALIIQLSLFWINYAGFGLLFSFGLLGFLKISIPKIISGIYFTIHFDLFSTLTILISSIFILLVPLVVTLFVTRSSSTLNKAVSAFILSDFSD